jgi:hypothetical protein
MNDPDYGLSTNVYDEASNLIETVDARGTSAAPTLTMAPIAFLTDDYHDENSLEFSYHRSPDVAYHYDEPAASVDRGDRTRATARNVKGGLRRGHHLAPQHLVALELEYLNFCTFE